MKIVPRMAPKPTSVADRAPGRLLIRMPNWLGDAVMALPAVGAVRAAFPDAYLSIGALPSILPVFEERTAAYVGKGHTYGLVETQLQQISTKY